MLRIELSSKDILDGLDTWSKQRLVLLILEEMEAEDIADQMIPENKKREILKLWKDWGYGR